MNFHVMTLFPEMIEQGLHTSILGRAMEAGYISLQVTNIRDFAPERKGRVDDYPYGGGAGMVMQALPIDRAYQSVLAVIEARKSAFPSEDAGRNTPAEDSPLTEKVPSAAEAPQPEKKPRVIYVTPQGRVFHQQMARELAQEEDLIFLCGHYEGVDERILNKIVTDHISIGDYVLTGGELPAMVMIDAISRMVPGVLSNDESGEIESFHDGLLEYPQYTRPAVYEGEPVPEILLSGNHKKVEEWRREQSIRRTCERRPDLLPTANLSEKERKRLMEDGSL